MMTSATLELNWFKASLIKTSWLLIENGLLCWHTALKTRSIIQGIKKLNRWKMAHEGKSLPPTFGYSKMPSATTNFLHWTLQLQQAALSEHWISPPKATTSCPQWTLDCHSPSATTHCPQWTMDCHPHLATTSCPQWKLVYHPPLATSSCP